MHNRGTYRIDSSQNKKSIWIANNWGTLRSLLPVLHSFVILIHSSFKSSSTENVNLIVFGQASFILYMNLFEIHSRGVGRSTILGRIFWPTAHYIGCWTILTVLFPAPNFIYKNSEATWKSNVHCYIILNCISACTSGFTIGIIFVSFCPLKNFTFILFIIKLFQCNIPRFVSKI